MLRKPRLLVLLAMVSMAVVTSADADTDDDAQRLRQALQDNNCTTRRAGVAAYLGSADNKSGHNASLLKLSAAEAGLRERVAALLEILTDDREGAARITALAEQIRGIESLSAAARPTQIEQSRDLLLKLVRDRAETFTARVGAPWLLTRALRVGSKDHPDWIPQWRKELEDMLRSQNDSLRVIAGVNAALGRFPEGKDLPASEIAPALIGGLGNASAIVRELASTGLSQITRSGPCFEATDPPMLRASSIQDWEVWRRQHNATLQSQVIKQVFW